MWCSENQLHSKFNELDVESNGLLNKKAIAQVLRDTNHSEAEIVQPLVRRNKEEINFEKFKSLVPGNVATLAQSPW